MARTVGAWGIAGLLLACATGDPVAIRLMTWNVGNPDVRDPHYALRLKYQRYEDFVGSRIRAAAPDIVFLQEVLSPTQCERFVERDASLTCWAAARQEAPVRRLLGPGYTIVCDARRHIECVGVRTSFGAITGVGLGALVLDAAETPSLPLAPCERGRGECSDERCDAESSVSAITVDTQRGPLRLVHVHPMAPGKTAAGVFWGEPCRYPQLQQVFQELATDGPTLVAGDFNLDPIRLIGAREAALWSQHVGAERRFRDLTPSVRDGTRYGTRRGSFGIATDHVLAEGATGVCTVHGHGIGPDPGTTPLDAGFDWSLLPGGESDPGRIDHFAITCELGIDLTASGSPEEAGSPRDQAGTPRLR